LCFFFYYKKVKINRLTLCIFYVVKNTQSQVKLFFFTL